MKIAFFITLVAIAGVPCFQSNASAECSVEQIISKTQERSERKPSQQKVKEPTSGLTHHAQMKIVKECKGEVDVPSCTVLQVIKFAVERRSAEDIKTLCTK
jgi:hypothetical protein